MAAKATTVWTCARCGERSRRWLGKCPSCGAYGTLEESAPLASGPPGHGALEAAAPAVTSPLADVEPRRLARQSTGEKEVDRVLGGGLVNGFYGLIAGEPGAGKSTLTGQLAIGLARGGKKVLLASGEESQEQVNLRMRRIAEGPLPEIDFTPETSAERLVALIADKRYDFVVIDSINTAYSENATGARGSIAQMRACADLFRLAAKEHGAAVMLVGQVNKDNEVAGPRSLEHAVDCFLLFEGDRRDQFRILRSLKNRFGPTDEIGVFEMTGVGLRAVVDPSGLFVSPHETPQPGVAVSAVIEGSRPILCEVQTLVNPSNLPQPIRASRGFDPKRLQMLLAVLARKAGYRRLAQCDVYVNVAGGIRVEDPGLDLAVCAALASAASGRAVKAGRCLYGEVSLLGEVRAPGQAQRRMREATRQGLLAVGPEGSLKEILAELLAPTSLETPIDGPGVE